MEGALQIPGKCNMLANLLREGLGIQEAQWWMENGKFCSWLNLQTDFKLRTGRWKCLRYGIWLAGVMSALNEGLGSGSWWAASAWLWAFFFPSHEKDTSEC